MPRCCGYPLRLMPRPFRNLFRLAPVLLWAGCSAGPSQVPADVAGEEAAVLRSWDEAVKVAAEKRAPMEVSWDQAVALMMRRNPELARARLDRANVRRDARRVWERLLPYMTVQVGQAGPLNSEDWRDLSNMQFTGFINLYLDKWVALPRDLYAVALSKARADAAWRAAVKAHLLDLYGRCEQLAAAQEEVVRLRDLSGLMERHPDYFRGRDRDDQRVVLRAGETKLRVAEAAVRDILGVPYESLALAAPSLPPFADKGAALLAAGLPQEGNAAFAPDPDWVGLMAIEGAGALARQRGIMVDTWPRLSAYLSPPNASYTQADGYLAPDFAETSASVYASWSPNWLLDAKDQMARAADDRKLLRQTFALQVDARLRQLEEQARVLREEGRVLADFTRREAAARQVAGQLPPKEAAELAERMLRWRAEAATLHHKRRMGLAQLWFMSDNNREVLTDALLEKE